MTQPGRRLETLDPMLRMQHADAEQTLGLLKRLVELESPSDHKRLVDELAQFVAGLLAELGFSLRWFERQHRGNHLLATTGAGHRLLVIGHLDTVWPTGEVSRRPFRVEAGRAYGPGVYDMKASIAALTAGLRGLVRSQWQPPYELAILLTSDEELASETSRTVVEELARDSFAALCLEPAPGPRSLVTTRKGLGNARVAGRGVAAHAGWDHPAGVNAIEAAARIALAVQSWTDYSVGTTTNVGYFRGGERINVVPDKAELMVDFRYATTDEGERIMRLLGELRSQAHGAAISVDARLDRGPMTRTPPSMELFRVAQTAGTLVGMEMEEAELQGATSDANLASAFGIPTLDGLGPSGEGAHALHESVVMEQLPLRAAFIANLLVACGRLA